MEYVVLLRAVNLGKRNQVNMERLRLLLVENGYEKVETILNSGNVIFTSDQTPSDIQRQIPRLISDRFKVDIEVFVLLKEVLQKSVLTYPLDLRNENQVAYVCVMNREVDLPLPLTIKHVELKHQVGTIVFCIGNLGKGHTSFPNDLIEKKYSVRCTSRNLQTIQRILKA